MRPRITKVWPLVHGIKGCDHAGNPLTLAAGIAGWMPSSEVQEAQDQGLVQIMAGLRPKDLKKPSYDTKVASPEVAETTPRKRRTYKRRDLTAEQPPAAE